MTAPKPDLAALYVTERHRLERQIGRRVGSMDTASDLVQDVFLRLWAKATRWTGDSGAYLNRCGRNAAIGHLRAERRRERLMGSLLPEQICGQVATPETILASRQDLLLIEQAVGMLPDRTRHIFLLNRIHGRSFSQIAGVMGISQRAVASHMLKAMLACERALEP